MHKHNKEHSRKTEMKKISNSEEAYQTKEKGKGESLLH
jgi:hypothetical protein